MTFKSCWSLLRCQLIVSTDILLCVFVPIINIHLFNLDHLSLSHLYNLESRVQISARDLYVQRHHKMEDNLFSHFLVVLLDVLQVEVLIGQTPPWSRSKHKQPSSQRILCAVLFLTTCSPVALAASIQTMSFPLIGKATRK